MCTDLRIDDNVNNIICISNIRSLMHITSQRKSSMKHDLRERPLKSYLQKRIAIRNRLFIISLSAAFEHASNFQQTCALDVDPQG